MTIDNGIIEKYGDDKIMRTVVKDNRYLLFLVLFLLWGLQSLHAQWISSQGLDGADASDVVVQDSMLFICTTSGTFMRDLNGGSWELKSSEPCQEIEKCQNALFTYTWFLCQRSLDQGTTWQNMTNVWNVGYITSMCTIDSALIFSSLLGTTGYIYRSDDMGNTIYPVMNNLPALEHPSISTGDGSTLFCFENFSGSKLFQSTDKGITWDSISRSGLPPSQCGIGTMCSLGSTLWISTASGLFMKNTLQGNWVLINDSLFFSKMGIMNGVLFATSSVYGIFRLNPVSNQWIAENTGLETKETKGFCTNGFDFFLATWVGPYTCDTSYTWLPFYDGLNQADLSTIAFLDDEVWAVTSRGTFTSTDHGTTFNKQVLNGMSNPGKLILTDSVFYALAANSFYWSIDHGNTWSKQHNGLPAPQPPLYLQLNSLVRSSEYLYLATNMGLFKSPFQPINWVKATPPGSNDPIFLTLYCDNSTLLAIKLVYSNGDYFYTFRSTDQGQTFDSISGLPVNYPLRFANDGSDFYALSFNRLYKSPDNGYTWTMLPIGNESIYGFFLSASEPAVIVGGSKLNMTLYDLYLAVTYDDGITWTDIQGNLPVPIWPVMAILEIDQERTFVSPSKNGLWYRDGVITHVEKYPGAFKAPLRIKPNPAQTYAEVTIDLSKACSGKVFVFSMTGTLVYKRNYELFAKGTNSIRLDVENFPPGMYIVSIITNEATYKGKLEIIKLP